MLTSVRLVALLVASGWLAGCQGGSLGNPSVNVLKDVDVERDAINGIWEMQKGQVLSEVTAHARLALPLVPYGDYTCRIRFARVVGQGSFNVIFPVGDTQAMLVVAGWPEEGTASGLEYVAGQRSNENITTDKNLELINHREYNLQLTVRTVGPLATVDVDIDDRPFIRWRGDRTELSLPTEWALDSDRKLGVGAYNAGVEVRSVLLRMLPGELSRNP